MGHGAPAHDQGGDGEGCGAVGQHHDIVMKVQAGPATMRKKSFFALSIVGKLSPFKNFIIQAKLY